MGDGIHSSPWRTACGVGLFALSVFSPLCFGAQAVAPAIPVPLKVNEPVNYSSTYRRGDRVEVRTAYIQQPGAAGDSQGFLGLKMKSKLGADLPLVRAELDYGSFNPSSSLALDNNTHRSFWMGAQSAWNGIQYGLNYQSMGRDFVALGPINAIFAPGKDRTEAWAQHRFGNLGIRTFAWYSKDQKSPDEHAVRFADTAVGTSFNYAFASAPYVDATLSYSRQITDQLNKPMVATDDGVLTHNLYGALSVRRTHWNATASTNYAYKADCTAVDGGPWDTWTETVTASFMPHQNLSVSPSFTYQTAPEPGLASRTRTRSAALALEMRPRGGPLLFTASSTMAARSNSAWISDATNFNSQAAIQMPLSFLGHERHKGSLALQIGYHESNDAYASNEDVLLNLELSLHQFN